MSEAIQGTRFPPVFLHGLRENKSAVISLCLSDVIVNRWEGSRTRLEPIHAVLEKRSSLLYNTEILILPRLCATDCQKGNSSSTLHFFPLFWSVLLFFQPAPHFLYCNLHFFLLLVITSLFSTAVFLSIFFCFFSTFFSSFQSCSFSETSSFASYCGVTDGNLRMKFSHREGAETQGSHNLLKRRCSNARFPVSSPLKLPRQFCEWGGRKVAMTTEGLIVSGAFCWWALWTPEWKLMMPSPGWCVSSTMT